MLSLILILIIIFIIAGVIGIAVKGLFWLFVIAAILFVITVLSSVFRSGHRYGRARGEKTLPPDGT